MESVYSTQADTALLLNNGHAHTSHHHHHPVHATCLGHSQPNRRHTPPLPPSSPSRERLRHSQPMHIQAVRWTYIYHHNIICLFIVILLVILKIKTAKSTVQKFFLSSPVMTWVIMRSVLYPPIKIYALNVITNICFMLRIYTHVHVSFTSQLNVSLCRCLQEEHHLRPASLPAIPNPFPELCSPAGSPILSPIQSSNNHVSTPVWSELHSYTLPAFIHGEASVACCWSNFSDFF